ncbi:MAG: hypothetical protein KGN79_03460 [Acidobacteriota bacterium]|nr:hypothetical protein [Acidobacteriota bacterium]
MAFSAAGLAFLLWLMSHDNDPKDERWASSLLWSMFWPVYWVYCRLLLRKHSAIAGSRTTRPKAAVFRTIQEAKEFLASSIAEEAQRNGSPLTEIEMKMLYFTETGRPLKDMKEVSAEFDRRYDQTGYERKIGELVNQIQVRLANQGQGEQERWNAALEKLSHGDHYLSVLANAARPSRKGLRHNLKLLIIALGFLLYAALDMYFRRWLRDH